MLKERSKHIFKRLKTKINSDQNFKDILKGSSLTFAAKIIGIVFGLATSLIIARYYGADVVGIVAIINSILAIFGIFALMGTNTAVLRLIPEYLQKYSISSVYILYKKTISIVLGLSLLGTIVLYLSSGLLSEYAFHKPSLEYFFIIASLFIGVQAMLPINQDVIRGLQKINLYALMQFLPSFINFFLIVIVTFLFFYKYNPVYVIFASSIIMLIITSIAVQRSFKSTVSTHNTEYIASRSEIIALSFPMFLANSMFIVIEQSDTIMLGIMRSETEVGIYSIAFKLAMMTMLIFTAVNSMAAPKFSQLYHSGKMEELKQVAQKSTKLIFWINLPIFIIYVLLGEYLLKLFGNEFKMGYYALIFLAMGQLILATVGSVGHFLNMTGHQNVFKNIIIMGGVLNIVLNLILIPNYGINGAAIASMVSNAAWSITAAIYIYYKFGFSIAYIPFKRVKSSQK